MLSLDGPLLWYLNRATGIVLLVLFTAVVVLGILATAGRAGRGVPRFVTQALHRNLALMSVMLLVAHIITAVVDTYVDIRWWQALVPVGATYKPVWLGLGTLAFDLLLVIVATSLIRTRVGHRVWSVIHLSAYGAWGVAIAHGLGIGTDRAQMQPLSIGCVAAVVVALVLRWGWSLLDGRRARARRGRVVLR